MTYNESSVSCVNQRASDCSVFRGFYHCFLVIFHTHPFSSSGETAEFIRNHGLDNLPIMAVHDFIVVPVTAELGRSFLSVDTTKRISYVDWAAPRDGDLS